MHHIHFRWLRQFAGVILIAGILAGISVVLLGRHRSAGTSKLQVTASYYPLYDFARQVGGNHVTVANITPAGAEPHDYEPTPQQLAQASRAAVLIYNGGQFESWTDKFVATYSHTAVRASQGVPLLTADPHFWLDPVLAQQVVDAVQQGLSKADPAHAADYARNAAAYKAKLTELDASFQRGLAHCRTRTIVTSHAAFSYVATRYNLKVSAIAGVSPDDEPSAAKLAKLTQLVRQEQIQYIFFERLVSPRLAQTIARETGAQTAVFDPIEGVSNADQAAGKDYLAIQRENLAALRTALGCQ